VRFDPGRLDWGGANRSNDKAKSGRETGYSLLAKTPNQGRGEKKSHSFGEYKHLQAIHKRSSKPSSLCKASQRVKNLVQWDCRSTDIKRGGRMEWPKKIPP